MMNLAENPYEDVANPLDTLEELLLSQQWAFIRPSADEITMSVQGNHCLYQMTFVWHEDRSAMSFATEYDVDIPKDRMEMARQSLPRLNEELWVGHFEIPYETKRPCFRHTSLFRGWTETSGADHVKELVEIALVTCERHFSFFNVLATTIYLPTELMDLALTEVGGEA